MSVQDRRRILGPAEARPLTFAVGERDSAVVEKETESSGSKESVYVATDLVSNANGSSYLEYTDGKLDQVLVLSSVFGPKPVRGGFRSAALLSIQFREITLEHLNTGEMKEICSFLTEVFNAVVNLEKYPKSGIDVFIDLIQHSNSNSSEEKNIVRILPTCINAVTMAFVDAGIEIMDLVSAGCVGNSMVAFIENGEKIVGIWSDDDEELSDVSEMVSACKERYLQNKLTLSKFLREGNAKPE